jgi:hypothetical protein
MSAHVERQVIEFSPIPVAKRGAAPRSSKSFAFEPGTRNELQVHLKSARSRRRHYTIHLPSGAYLGLNLVRGSTEETATGFLSPKVGYNPKVSPRVNCGCDWTTTMVSVHRGTSSVDDLIWRSFGNGAKSHQDVVPILLT